MTKIDSFAIGEICWVRYGKGVISFAFKGILEDVHFSIAYAGNSPFVNFHVTRNIGNPQDKPKIEIARMPKEDLEKLAPELYWAVFHTFFEPLKLTGRGRRRTKAYHGVSYFPFDHFDRDNPTELGREIMAKFEAKMPMETRKRKIKFLIEDEVRMGEMQSKEMLSPLLRGFGWLPRKPDKPVTGGIVSCPHFKGVAIYFYGRWYRWRKNVDLMAMLYGLMNPDLVGALVERTLLAVKRIGEANSFEETRTENQNTILLHFLPPDNWL